MANVTSGPRAAHNIAVALLPISLTTVPIHRPVRNPEFDGHTPVPERRYQATMPTLLVSVRSADEARLAWSAGARVIDIKEPRRGPLGRADIVVWRAVRAALPAHAPVSVALGELTDTHAALDHDDPIWAGIRWRKIGLSALAQDPCWRARFDAALGDRTRRPRWIAVAYVDANAASAPDCDDVIDAAIATQCDGILFDTWNKSQPNPIEANHLWRARIDRARTAGLTIALAGGLDAPAIKRLRPLEPDIFAVRGAACSGAAREAQIDPHRVRRLALAVH